MIATVPTPSGRSYLVTGGTGSFGQTMLRGSIERPDALDSGAIIMTGLGPTGLVEATAMAIDLAAAGPVPYPADYEIRDVARRVVTFIASAVRRHHEWAGIRATSLGVPT